MTHLMISPLRCNLLRQYRHVTSISKWKSHPFSQYTKSINRKVNQEILNIWHSATAVCFDVDSTVCTEEGIDILAEYCGVRPQVEEWTTKAMDGNVKFEDALEARLNIIRPSKKQFRECLKANPPNYSKGILRLITTLQAKGIEVFLVSGGFRLMIEPIAKRLDIPCENIYANTVFFDQKGEYAGFDATELTSCDGGKARVIYLIKQSLGHKTVVMVGDGVTDLQARPPADLFVGYGGVVARKLVIEQADWYITGFHYLTETLDDIETQ